MQLADLRREYLSAGLTEADAGPDPIRLFQLWLGQALAAELPGVRTLRLRLGPRAP